MILIAKLKDEFAKAVHKQDLSAPELKPFAEARVDSKVQWLPFNNELGKGNTFFMVVEDDTKGAALAEKIKASPAVTDSVGAKPSSDPSYLATLKRFM
ncbi:MAG: hypothetical protein OXT65_01335 [Alphaproteobacteria bacterium]|nr:hypothetical protein [Alphaproteobacteria bacterium]